MSILRDKRLVPKKTVDLLASVASPVTDHVNGENIYLDLCLTLCSMMRMLSKYVRTYGGHFISHMRTQM